MSAYIVIWTQAENDLGVDVAASEAGGEEVVDGAENGGEDVGCGNDLRRKFSLEEGWCKNVVVFVRC